MAQLYQIPTEFELYGITHEKFIAIVRAPTGADLRGLDLDSLNSISNLYDFYLKLHIKSTSPLEEESIDMLNKILECFAKELLAKCLMPLDSWLEFIYIVGGKQFSPNWKEWEQTPLTVLMAMAEVAKKHPSAF